MNEAVEGRAPVCQRADRRPGEAPEGKTIVITVTGHGLKDPQWALEPVNGAKVEPTKAAFDVVAVADILDLN